MEFVLVGLTVLYLVPWIASEAMAHPRRYWILALNITVGWTGVGWLLLLAWACEAPLRRRWARPTGLQLVGRDELHRSGQRWHQLGGYLVRGLLVLGLAAAAYWLLLVPPQRRPISGRAELVRTSAVLRSGPDDEWPSLGTLEPPCLMRLMERQGQWLRVWRLAGCRGSMRQRSGWLRSADVTRR